MRLPSADQDDALAKAALFSKYAELLPAALMLQQAQPQQQQQQQEGTTNICSGASEGLPVALKQQQQQQQQGGANGGSCGGNASKALELVSDLLGGIREVVGGGDRSAYQVLFRCMPDLAACP